MPTAWQYGEVVLPDAASGNRPGTRRQVSHITVTVQGTPSPRLRCPKEGETNNLPLSVLCVVFILSCYF